MLVELNVVEQRYQAVLEVINDGASVTDGWRSPREATSNPVGPWRDGGRWHRSGSRVSGLSLGRGVSVQRVVPVRPAASRLCLGPRVKM